MPHRSVPIHQSRALQLGLSEGRTCGSLGASRTLEGFLAARSDDRFPPLAEGIPFRIAPSTESRLSFARSFRDGSRGSTLSPTESCCLASDSEGTMSHPGDRSSAADLRQCPSSADSDPSVHALRRYPSEPRIEPSKLPPTVTALLPLRPVLGEELALPPLTPRLKTRYDSSIAALAQYNDWPVTQAYPGCKATATDRLSQFFGTTSPGGHIMNRTTVVVAVALITAALSLTANAQTCSLPGTSCAGSADVCCGGAVCFGSVPTCQLPSNEAPCSAADQCVSGVCGGTGTCYPTTDLRAPCITNADCAGYLECGLWNGGEPGMCLAPAGDGGVCSADADCITDVCCTATSSPQCPNGANHCGYTTLAGGGPCASNHDCLSGECATDQWDKFRRYCVLPAGATCVYPCPAATEGIGCCASTNALGGAYGLDGGCKFVSGTLWECSCSNNGYQCISDADCCQNTVPEVGSQECVRGVCSIKTGQPCSNGYPDTFTYLCSSGLQCTTPVYGDQNPICPAENGFCESYLDCSPGSSCGCKAGSGCYMDNLNELTGLQSAHFGHREQADRRIVTTGIGHRDRSAATLV